MQTRTDTSCKVLRIALTSGEPSGIGPDLLVAVAQEPWPVQLIAVGDPGLLLERARLLALPLELTPYVAHQAPAPHRPGQLPVAAVELNTPVRCGELDTANAEYVLDVLRRACGGCRNNEFQAMVTAPLHKGVINDAGIPFTGHTEFLAELTQSPLPVMMLTAPGLRVALVTTHLPLADVPAAIKRERVEQTIRIVLDALNRDFGLASPRVLVCGLNPHAGESGHLGREEIEHIAPVLKQLRAEGHDVRGPLPADTAFVPQQLHDSDVVVTMYHDQGLPVLKHRGFGEAVNITLGLPIIRTSVDHGTALDLAGTGRADCGSLQAAIKAAVEMATTRADLPFRV
jgi:4-hydroxythreonine-4-phosphate dehydrogenase